MPSTTQDLFDNLDVKHPDYTEAEEDWDVYRDILGDAQVDKAKYLPRGKQENDGIYKLRVALSQFLPESALALQKILAGLYGEKPKRELKDASLEDWTDDVDGAGTHWNQYVVQIAEKLLGYGTLRLLVNIDPPEVPEGRELNRADELKAGAKPFLVLYDPKHIVDWEVDTKGRLMMVRIKEKRVVKAEPPAHHGEVTRFIQYTREHVSWWEFQDGTNGIELIGESIDVRHGLGIVPMVVDYFPKRVKPMVGSSYIKYSSRADIQKYQAESDLSYNAHIHAHPTLWAKIKGSLSSIGIGANSFIKLDPDKDESIGYCETPTGSFEALKAIIDEKREVIFRQAGTDPLGVMQGGASAFQASGVSRAWSFGTSESRVLGAIADRMEAVERATFEIVTRYTNGKQLGLLDQAFAGEINYPEEFDLSATETLISETERIAQMVNSETLLRTLHLRIAASKVGDATAKTLKTIQDEIEKNPLIGTEVGKPPPKDPASMPPNEETDIPDTFTVVKDDKKKEETAPPEKKKTKKK